MPKNVIIVGAPRSGTSMTARIFKQKGYFVTDDESNELQEANEFNPHGFWESAGLRKCNSEIFSRVDFPFENTWLFETIGEERAKSINALKQETKHAQFVEKYDSQKPWMWKDPSLCYTIGYWWPLINPETTRIILLRRNQEEIYKSFVRLQWNSNDQSKEDILQRVNHHIDFAEKTLNQNNIPYMQLDYSDFSQKPGDTANKISRYFDIDIEIDELGYDKKLNTSNQTHLVIIDKIGRFIPGSLRKIIKKLVPAKLLRKIFPNRYIDSM